MDENCCLSICSLGKDESQVVGEEINNFSVIQFHRSYIDPTGPDERSTKSIQWIGSFP